MRVKRAFSLLEVVLASTLLLLLLGTLLSLVVPMMRASDKANELSDLRQMGALCLESIAEEVEQSGAPGLALYVAPSAEVALAFSVHKVLGLNADGSAVWERTVLLFAWDQVRQRVERHDLAASQGRPYRFLLPDLVAALASSRRVLATDVVLLEVSGLSAHGLKPPLVLSIELRRNQSFFTLQQSVLPGVRNLH